MKWAQIERLGVWDPGPYPELKIDVKNYNQHFIKHGGQQFSF